MFDEFLYVLGAALARVTLRGLLRVTLRSRIEGYDAKVLGKELELQVPYPGGHAPPGFEKDGRSAASFEIMKLHSIASLEEAAFDVRTSRKYGQYQRKQQPEKNLTQHGAPHSSTA